MDQDALYVLRMKLREATRNMVTRIEWALADEVDGPMDSIHWESADYWGRRAAAYVALAEEISHA